MRPLKELLQILLDEVERNGAENGLCVVTFVLQKKNVISEEEENILDDFIEENLFKLNLRETAPRIEFLKNEIEKL